ncbi:MAG: ankyrin repeat domain-containing protein, partial [Bacteroidales bacterium]|nr:ankyrin repeat domain-containing protein [Bacteroidales bacterium]
MISSLYRIKREWTRFLPFLLFLWLNGFSLLANKDSSSLFTAIDSGDLGIVKEFFLNNDINGYYGEKNLTPLTYAIQQNQYTIVKLLVKMGADVNQLCQDKTPLIHSVQTNKIKLTKYLIKKGADINGLSERGNNALIYAAYEGIINMSTFLVRKGIDYNYQNNSGYTALDHANKFNNIEVARYLRSVSARSIATTYPDYLDGPHIFWMDDKNVTAIYMKRDSAEDKTTLETKELVIRKNSYEFAGFAGDTSDYVVYKEKAWSPFMFSNVEDIFAVGDVHGGYETLVELLQNQGIIDSYLNWSWGKGHLIFLGDVFDRGEKVTECLWLIYKLERQAHARGGAVHLIMGNHELMIMTDDL